MAERVLTVVNIFCDLFLMHVQCAQIVPLRTKHVIILTILCENSNTVFFVSVCTYCIFVLFVYFCVSSVL